MSNNTQQTTIDLIEKAYKEYSRSVIQYIGNRINHTYDAEDLAQDVFVRLLDCKQMVRPDTVKYFLFTIARNLVTDYLRRYYKKQEMDLYLYATTPASHTEMESNIYMKELFLLEKQKLASFPKQRQIVYTLNRYDEKTSSEISSELNLSKRTVENHLFIGRKIMREFIKKSI